MCLGRSKYLPSNADLILNLHAGNISPQFNVAFDDYFETISALLKGVERTRLKWIAIHKRERHLDDDDNIINGTKNGLKPNWRVAH